MFEIRKVLGEIPILASEQRLLDEAEAADESKGTNESAPEQPKAITTTKVLADGTYATETVYTSNAATARLELVRAAAKPPLRSLILGGDFFTGSVLAATVTKLVLRYAEEVADDQAVNSLRAEVSIHACLTVLIAPGNPHHDLYRPRRSIEICRGSHRRGLSRENHELCRDAGAVVRVPSAQRHFPARQSSRI